MALMAAYMKVIEQQFCLIILGIFLLKEIPSGKPALIPLALLYDDMVKDIPFFYDQLQQESREWWDKFLSKKPLPSIVLPEGSI